jgi:cytochrome c553
MSRAGRNSASQAVPRLNGQQADYIVAQFQAFHDPGQEDPRATAAMWDVVRPIDASTLAEIAAYYAQLPPVAPGGSGAIAAEDRKLFENGDPCERIVACQSCHGAQGQRRGAAPQLSGRHGEYLKNQLDRLRFGLRASGVMHPMTNAMTDSQIEELVACLAGI